MVDYRASALSMHEPPAELLVKRKGVAMSRPARWVIGLMFVVAAGSSLFLRSSAADPDDLTNTIAGEWSLPTSRDTADDTLVVWTFEADGIVRLDAIDAQNREKVREGPMVGRWRVDGKELVCRWEVWDDRRHRPAEGAQTEERFRVRSVSKKELVLLVVARRGRPVSKEEIIRYKRFPGWEQERRNRGSR
jgi:hypothetical protein